MKKIIVLTGGGTGGHVVPHLSILPSLTKDFDVHYVGTNGIEKEIMKDKPVKYHTISASKLDRSKKLSNLLLPFKLISSIRQCKKILKEIKPDVVFSKGGFVSLPVVIAAKSCKIKVISHESDFSMGLANKIIYRFCDVFCTSFEQTAAKLKKAVATGSPIRENLKFGSKEKGYLMTKIDRNRPTILFMGGSTGAKAINDCVISSLDLLLPEYNIIHIVGKGKTTNVKAKNYCQLEFVDNIEDIFAISDYIVSRAGSNAIFEFLYLKKPTLLIPLPKGASRGDQVDNADDLLKRELVHVLNQENLTPRVLAAEIRRLKEDSKILINNMENCPNINGTENLLGQIHKLVNKR